MRRRPASRAGSYSCHQTCGAKYARTTPLNLKWRTSQKCLVNDSLSNDKDQGSSAVSHLSSHALHARACSARAPGSDGEGRCARSRVVVGICNVRLKKPQELFGRRLRRIGVEALSICAVTGIGSRTGARQTSSDRRRCSARLLRQSGSSHASKPVAVLTILPLSLSLS